MQWPEGWEQVPPNTQQALEAELRREISSGHPLYAANFQAIARRGDCDDVMFALDGSSTVAVVHLSYGMETGADWPHTQLYGSLGEWSKSEMQP